MVFNQVHATAWHRKLRKTLEKIIYLCVIALGCGIWFTLPYRLLPERSTAATTSWWLYAWACLLISIPVTLRWLYRKSRPAPPAVREHTRYSLDLAEEIKGPAYHGWQAKLLKLIPGNQMLQLAVEHKSLALPSLPQDLQGLRIAHLADLHFTGKIDKQYFQLVTRQINRLQADFICLTGDIVDNPSCLGWIDELLSTVHARFQKLYVLGNHDRRIPNDRSIRDAMQASGWIDATGDWTTCQVGKARLAFTGNEYPWFAHPAADPDRDHDANELRIVLAHSPDQLDWARRRHCQLMLAGHTHGGQVRFPWIGPVIAPSRYGVRFASGVFTIGNMLMHVTRGVSCDDPIRWNCPPEITLLTLVAENQFEV